LRNVPDTRAGRTEAEVVYGTAVALAHGLVSGLEEVPEGTG
jgi:hypothetical protein